MNQRLTELKLLSPAGQTAGWRSALRLTLLVIWAMRPHQWAKNTVVFAAFVFSAQDAWQPRDPGTWLPLLGTSLVAFGVFCLISSAQYLLNDVLDRNNDAVHPTKRFRPIAAGLLPVKVALGAAVAWGTIGITIGLVVSFEFGAIAACYLALSIVYSAILKHLVIVDVLAIGVGFALRAVGGAAAIDVPASSWLYLIAFLGAVFLAVTKRQGEMELGGLAAAHRQVLGEYSSRLLDQMSAVLMATVVVTYALYAATAENLPSNNSMLATVPFVLYGLFRYQYVSQRYPHRGPEERLLRDVPSVVAALLFGAVALVILIVWRDAESAVVAAQLR